MKRTILVALLAGLSLGAAQAQTTGQVGQCVYTCSAAGCTCVPTAGLPAVAPVDPNAAAEAAAALQEQILLQQQLAAQQQLNAWRLMHQFDHQQPGPHPGAPFH